jgi:molybdopterin-guanine dinucleotide biosynthesis protein A
MDYEAFILIGGKSSRMGRDKFSLILQDKTLLEIAVETLQNFGNVSVVANHSEPSAIADGLNIIKDIHQNRGAVGGIHSALIHSKNVWTIILACDYPFVTVELIGFLTSLTKLEKDFDAFAPIQADGKIQPLCAVYQTETCRKVLSEMLENEANYSVRDFLHRIKTRYIEFSEISHLPKAENLFFNLNTPEDFERAKQILSK